MSQPESRIPLSLGGIAEQRDGFEARTCLTMIMDEAIHCPSCGQCGYPVGTATADPRRFLAVMCHYCGCVLDREQLAQCRTPTEVAAQASAPRLLTRPGPKLLR